MFRPRASFDFVARTQIFYLFLVFALHGKASDATVEFNEFGCEFSDNDYSVKLTDNKQPVWSNRTIDSRYRVDDYNNIEDSFKQLFSEVNIMNTLSLFEKLVRNYKNSNYTSFESFFNNYQVPFQHQKQYYNEKKVIIRKTQDPASYLIQELHTLQESLNKQKWISQEKRGNTPLNTPYLVSAYINPEHVNFYRHYLRHIAADVSLEELHGKRVQDHLAGIIPIYIGRRTGYILIDPGYANGYNEMYEPFVAYVMKDRQSPHGDYIRGTKSLGNDLQFVVKDDKNGNPFILARHENPRYSEITYVIYSIGKPYCSFMENTIKPKLVRPYHEIIKHNNETTLEWYLDFKITPESKQFSKSIFTGTSETNGTLEPNEAFKTKIKRQFFTNFSSYEEVSVIIDQYRFIQTYLLDDADFVAQLTGFTKSLGLDPEPGNKPVVTKPPPQLSNEEKIDKFLTKICRHL